MPSLQVRDLPDAVYRALSSAASREHRSLTQQAVAVLARGLGLAEDPRRRRQELLERIRERPHEQAGDAWPDPTTLLGQDRAR